MKKKVKWIGLAVVVLAAVAAAIASLLTPAAVPLTRVSPQRAELTLLAQGSVAGDRVVAIYPLTSGALLEVYVTEGQRVKAGDLICAIDPEPILQQIRQAESGIQSSRAQQQNFLDQTYGSQIVRQEQLQLQSLRIQQGERDLAQARTDLERLQSLYDIGALALVELEEASAAAAQLELALQSSRAEYAILQADADGASMSDHYEAMIALEQSKLALLERELENCTVTVAADGVISALPVLESNYVSVNAPVAELTVTESLRVKTDISTRDVDSIREGDEVLLRLKRRGGDTELSGKISKIAETAELSISSLGLEEYRVKVEIQPGPLPAGAGFGAGYDVEVEFILYREEDRLLVPKSALFRLNGSDMLWLADNGRLRAVEVQKGMELRTQFVIEGGLAPDDLVVSDANDKLLKNGLRVGTEER